MNNEEKELHDKLAVLFKEEAADHLQTFSQGLTTLEKSSSPEDEEEVIHSLFRAAHSLKGASRAINFYEIEGLCATLEEVLDSLKNRKIQVTSTFLETLYEATDTLDTIILQNEDKRSYSTTELIEKIEALISGTPPSEKEEKPPPPPPTKEEKKQPLTEQLTRDTIRVSSKKIDHLLQHVEEMLMIKLSSQQKIKELETLQHLINHWNKNSIHQSLETSFQQMYISLKYNKDGNKEILNRFLNQLNVYFERKKELISTISDKISSLGNLCEKDHRMVCSLVDNVIEDTKEILMQPFSTLLDGLPKMAREIAQSLNKIITIEITGDEIEVDRRILERLKDPMIHFIRNCIDHGIEEPEVREQMGKDPKGAIHISTKQISGNAFEVTLSDDGAGIDFDKIKEKARTDGLFEEEELESLTEKDLIKLLFKPGFSTSPIVTNISGRGIGLNVLDQNVEKLGGSVAVTTQKGNGTQFKITMPLTMATFRGIHVKVIDQDFIIPTHNVVRVFRDVPNKLNTVESQSTITIDDEVYSFVELSQVLGIPKKEEENTQRLKPALLIKASDIHIAIGVDEIYAEQEVFVKGLGKQLQRVKTIAATTIMEWGKVIPILDPFDLVEASTGNLTSPITVSAEEAKEEVEQASILIVEDSITSRMLLKNILETAGYHVRSAVDGIEGFECLQREHTDLIVSDVEMPRMNGFDLTAKIRSSEKYKDLPLILCTSRGSKEDREHGIEVGANAYMDKSNFKQKDLLEVIDQLLG